MKKLAVCLFAWTLFSTQVFAEASAFNQQTNADEKSYFARLNNINQKDLESAIALIQDVTLEDAQSALRDAGIEEELPHMNEEEWKRYKGEAASMLNSFNNEEVSSNITKVSTFSKAVATLQNYWMERKIEISVIGVLAFIAITAILSPYLLIANLILKGIIFVTAAGFIAAFGAILANVFNEHFERKKSSKEEDVVENVFPRQSTENEDLTPAPLH